MVDLMENYLVWMKVPVMEHELVYKSDRVLVLSWARKKEIL